MTRTDPRWVVPERGNRLAMGMLLALAQRLGRRRVGGLLWPICLYFFLTHPAARRGSVTYLRRVLDRAPTARDTLCHMHVFAQYVLDRVFFLLDTPDRPTICVTGRAAFEDAVAKGRGCLLLSAHIGSFEALRVIGLGHDIRMRMLMYRAILGGTTAALEALAPGYAASIIPIGREDTMLRVAESLAQGEVVGVLGDRTASVGRTVRVPFLGREVQLPDGPFRLALATGAPVVLARALRQRDGSYEVRFEPLSVTMPSTASDRARFIREAASHYAAWMEAACREQPFAWFNFYDYWKDVA